MRKYQALLFFAFVLVGGTACQRNLSSSLERARATFAEKNYVDTIDLLNSGLNNWDEAEGMDPKAEAYEILGKSYRMLRNMDKALDAYNQSIAAAQNRFDPYYDMGSIYLTKGIADQAERMFREALRVQPDNPRALLGLGNSLFVQRKTNEAHDAFERILDVSPGVRDALDSLSALRKNTAAAAKPHTGVTKTNKNTKTTKAKKPVKKPTQGKRR